MASARSFVLQDVKLFNGLDVIERGYIVVQDGLIREVADGPVPGWFDLPRVSCPGDTIIPGLIDCHIHALGGNPDSVEQSLRFGVTTVCDMHNNPEDNEKVKELARTDKSRYADFKCAGFGALVDGGWPVPVIKKAFDNKPNGAEIAEMITSSWPKLRSELDVDAFVHTQVHQNGASYIKMMHEVGDSVGMALPVPSMEIQKRVVTAAHGHGVIAVGHAFSHAGALALLEAKVNGLTHIFFDQPRKEEMGRLLQAMKQNNCHCNPTLALCGVQTGEVTQMTTHFVEDPFAQRMLAEAYKQPHNVHALAHGQPQSKLQHAIDNSKALYAAGIPLLVGSDAAGHVGTNFGLGVHMEIYMLVHKVGMSPVEALRCATGLTADRFGFHDRGKIQAGRLADLVLIDGDVFMAMRDERGRCLPIKNVWREGVPAAAFN